MKVSQIGDPARLFELAFTKAIMNLRSEASRTYLSYIWWILEPMMFIGIYYVVFALLLNRGGKDFVSFLLIGVTHWLWFAKSVSNACTSILQGSGLMSQIDIPKIFFPLVVVIQDSIKQIPVFVVMVIFLLFYGIQPSLTWLAWPFVLFCEFLLIMGIAVAAAATVPFMPDLRILIITALQFLMFLSGVFYRPEIIPEKYRDLFFINPMAKILHFGREVLTNGQWPDWGVMAILMGFCCFLLFFVAFIVYRLDHVYPKLVLE